MTDEWSALPHALARAHDDLLHELLAVQRDEVRRRRRRRGLRAGALAVLATALVSALQPSTSPSRVAPGPIEWVESVGASPLEYVAAAPLPLDIDVLTDDDLLAELRAMGVDVAIARVDGRVLLVGR